MTATFYVGDAIEVMNKLPENSVDLILTSPPFLALRSYLPADHESKHLEGGSQATPGAFIDWLIDVVEACDRVLAPHGSLCIELGDTYAGSGGAGGDYDPGGWREGQAAFEGSGKRYIDSKYERIQYGDKGPPIANLHGKKQGGGTGWPLAKSLSLIPELFRLTLVYGTNPLTGRQTDRWRLRNVVRWVRPNPPVGALGDKFRPATSELMVFCKSAKRYFDLDAVREPFKPETLARFADGKEMHYNKAASAGRGGGWSTMPEGKITTAGAPPLDWWNIPLLEGEEETRYGPKGPRTNAEHNARYAKPGGGYTWLTESEREDVQTGLGPMRGVSTVPNNPLGAPPLDWWKIPLTPDAPDWICRAPELADEACFVDNDPVATRQPREHSKCGWFWTSPAIPNTLGAPPLDWWNIPPGGYQGAHYAVFPPELCVKPIKAMCPEKVCRGCGEPSRRIVGEAEYVNNAGRPARMDMNQTRVAPGVRQFEGNGDNTGHRIAPTLGFSDCGHNDWRPGLVLDPFVGSGTTLMVATGHGRDAVGIDLDARNFDLALERVGPFILERAEI